MRVTVNIICFLNDIYNWIADTTIINRVETRTCSIDHFDNCVSNKTADVYTTPYFKRS